jgi:hypothetical protein
MLELSLLPSDCLAHFNEFRGEPSGIRVDVSPQHGALTYMILDVPLPLRQGPGLTDAPCPRRGCESAAKKRAKILVDRSQKGSARLTA